MPRTAKIRPEGYQQKKTIYIKPEDWDVWERAIGLTKDSGQWVTLSELVTNGLRREVKARERSEAR